MTVLTLLTFFEAFLVVRLLLIAGSKGFVSFLSSMRVCLHGHDYR